MTEIGLEDASRCIGESAFSVVGNDCFLLYQQKKSYGSVVKVILNEPEAFFKEIAYSTKRMQRITINYLGKYSLNDPMEPVSTNLNLWSTFKTSYFPRGDAFVGSLILCATIFFLARKRQGFYKDLSVVGSLTLIGCIIDFFVAILGDGTGDLVRHLILANILFDLMLISAANMFLLDLIEILPKIHLKMRNLFLPS